MTRAVGVIQARLTSIRLARKALLPLCGRPVIHHLFDRALRIKGLDDFVLAIPEGEAHDPIAEAAVDYPQIKIVRGPDDDLVSRFLMAADLTGADILVRMWGDCPVTDPNLAGGLLQAAISADAAWACYPGNSGFPEGVETHVLKTEALRTLERETRDMYERETMIPFFERLPDRFPKIEIHRKPDRSHLKCLLDTVHDYHRISKIFDALYPQNPLFGVAEIEALAEREPKLFDPTYRVPQDPQGDS
ncbi:MAG: NTP transferase domain-containing protein [Rhodospirillales bacterium]